jgi:glycerol uptake facilitator protein
VEAAVTVEARATIPEPPDRGPAAFVAEFIGTFGLVFFITAAISLFVEPPTSQGPGLPEVQPFIDWSVIGFVHVFVLFMLIQTIAVISGAHFNPAVTVAMAAIRQIKPIDAAIYVVVQLIGGIAGAFLTKALLNDTGDDVNFGATVVNEDRIEGHIFSGMAIEALGAFFLVWAIVGVAVNPRAARDWAALAIAGTLGLVVFVAGPMTGAGVNPARVLGPALAGKEFNGADDFLVVYTLGPIVGAVLAAAVYFYLFILPGRREPGGMRPVG